MATPAELHLALAERHIAEAEARIARQEVLIERLAVNGRDTARAEALLRTMLAIVSVMRTHRRLILRELARQERHPHADPG